MQDNQNKQLRSQLLQVHLVGIKFSGASCTKPSGCSSIILRVCNINGARYVVSNDIPFCRLRSWDWAKPHNLRVYSLNDHKPLNIIPLQVVQQNRNKVYHSLHRLPSGCALTFERALQAAGMEGIPTRYNHSVSDDQWSASRLARQAWDMALHPHSKAYKTAAATARPGLLGRILAFVGL